MGAKQPVIEGILNKIQVLLSAGWICVENGLHCGCNSNFESVALFRNTAANSPRFGEGERERPFHFVSSVRSSCVYHGLMEIRGSNPLFNKICIF